MDVRLYGSEVRFRVTHTCPDSILHAERSPSCAGYVLGSRMRSAGIRYQKVIHSDGTLTEKLRISVGLLNPETKRITLCVPEEHHSSICEAQINFSPFRYRSSLLQNSITLRTPDAQENLPALMMTMISQGWEWTVSVPDEMVCITHNAPRGGRYHVGGENED